MAVARAAIDAGEFAVARRALDEITTDRPTQRACLLQAEISAKEHGDHGRAREWMARALRAARDPVWTADGQASDVWLPASPVTGRLDAFEWKVPVAEIGGPVLQVDDVLADHHEAEQPAGADPGHRHGARGDRTRPRPAPRPARSPVPAEVVKPPEPEAGPGARRPTACRNRPRRRWPSPPTTRPPCRPRARRSCRRRPSSPWRGRRTIPAPRRRLPRRPAAARCSAADGSCRFPGLPPGPPP
jgi:HemY protein